MSTPDPALPLNLQRTRAERIVTMVFALSLSPAFILLDKAFPFEPEVPPYLGIPVFAAGIALAVWSWRTLRRAGTTNDWKSAANALVTHGPYQLSRNPFCLGLILFIVGLGLLISKGWLFHLAAVMTVWASLADIPREEAHLAALFGDEWTDYAARTRRWL